MTVAENFDYEGVVALEPEFVDLILEDGVATLSEMQQSYLGYLECLVQNGGSGEYYLNLDLQSSMPYTVGFGHGIDATDADFEATDRILAGCEASFLGNGTVIFQFMEDHEYGPDVEKRRLEAIRTCVAGLDEELGEAAAEIDEIPLLYELDQRFPRLSVGLYDCITTNGEGNTPFGE